MSIPHGRRRWKRKRGFFPAKLCFLGPHAAEIIPPNSADEIADGCDRDVDHDYEGAAFAGGRSFIKPGQAAEVNVIERDAAANHRDYRHDPEPHSEETNGDGHQKYNQPKYVHELQKYSVRNQANESNQPKHRKPLYLSFISIISSHIRRSNYVLQMDNQQKLRLARPIDGKARSFQAGLSCACDLRQKTQ